ncbi:MAG: ParA family protein [Parasporobacterium sp.]|nr:ParA family protein [Parasporobacterium sp.]
MKKIICIVNRKGGVGKTATAWTLGAGLIKRGERVLYVDLDSQCNLTFDMGVDDAESSSMEVLTNETDIRRAICHTELGDIIPGSPELAAADQVIDSTGKEYRLKEALEQVEKDYDYVIIDTPPALGTLTVNALTAGDWVIVPVQAEVHSLQGISLLVDAVKPVKKYCNPKIEIKGILITRYNGRSIISRDMHSNLEEVAAQIGTKLFRTNIRECTALKEAQAVQQNIFDYAPKSNAAADYSSFIDEVLE